MTRAIQRPSPRAPALLLKATVLWGAIGVLAVGNGVVREALLEPALGPILGLSASGISLSVLVLLVAYAGAPWLGHQPAARLAGIGVYWLVLTLLFETGLGWLVLAQSPEDLLRPYSFAGGNLWLLVLAVVTAAPWLAGKARGLT